MTSRTLFIAFNNSMKARRLLMLLLVAAWSQAQDAGVLPRSVRPVWNVKKAYHETTSTRERICVNGLWQWQPARDGASEVPQDGWGYFKVPGCWPGATHYMQKDTQTVHAHPDWKNRRMRSVRSAWYQRKISIPRKWSGRRIALHAEYLNSHAAVHINGARAGEMRFPGGEMDVTGVCRPGKTCTLSLLVTAMPLKGVMLSYNDTASARRVRGSVTRRGLCGDVFLTSTPRGERIQDVRIDTSVRRSQITLSTALAGMQAGKRYALRVRILEGGRKIKEFTSRRFTAADLQQGRFVFAETWRPAGLWDVHTPGNMLHLQMTLLDRRRKVIDAYWPIRFGFREFWIEGRDFYMNGSRIFLSSVPLDNAQVSTATSTYEAARESFERLKRLGINYMYTHNYGCEPGSHLGFEEILRAADDTGMLVGLSQPHFGHYDWDAPDADASNGYARHAEFYVRVAQNHPSVVFHVTSHNATSDAFDMDPDLMGCDYADRVTGRWSLKNRRKAARAAAIVRNLDPGRIVYHHSSGSFGPIHTSNFYPNWAPIQEMSDWFEHWAAEGVKPVFTCEYGTPFSWDWAMYRGWYKGKRAFGSARVPWEFCLAEWNAQFFGDRAFRISDMEKRNLRWEAGKARAGAVWCRWDYPHRLGSRDFPERDPVFAAYITDNYRAFRTWGLSAYSPWEHRLLWRMRKGLDRNARKDLKTDWQNLQRPGFSPDFMGKRYERMDLAYERSDWVPTAAARALLRNNRPLLAYIGGKPGAFTCKGHNFIAGDRVEKQIIVVNNSRETVTFTCEWMLHLPQPVRGSKKGVAPTGTCWRTPLRFELPRSSRPGTHELTAAVTFSTGEVQEDVFAIHVLPSPTLPATTGRIALFDPEGETGALLRDIAVDCRPVEADVDCRAYDILIIGKRALTVDGPGPDIRHTREGLKVVVFEQTPEVLEKRFGFRIAVRGMRRAFKRVSGHPLLAGLSAETLRDWHGKATILPPRITSGRSREKNHGRVYTWAGIPVTRGYRAGNRGSVASAVIEKPACGDFRPVVDCGFSLQYSPLLEYREGKGVVLFCQMDVTGRTETDPAAKRLAGNILAYLSAWKPLPRRSLLFAGDAEGKKHLESTGVAVRTFNGKGLTPDHVLVVGPGGARQARRYAGAIGAWLGAGGHLLAVSLDQKDANAILPFKVTMKRDEHINAFFDPPGADSLLAGVGPADVHNRDPRKIPLISAGATVIGNGVLAVPRKFNVVFCQLAPWQFPHRTPQFNKRTFRRTAFLLMRLLGNMGVGADTPLLSHVSRPASGREKQGRWLQGLYLDVPVEWDDPYRFFRW